MAVRIWVLAFCALLGTRWAEPGELPDPSPWVPASANFIVYLDWNSFFSSPVLRGLESSLIESKSWTEIEELRALTGMDPLHDVWALTYFTTKPGEDGGAQWGIACYGAFDPGQVIENLEAHGKVRRSKYRETALYDVSGIRLGLGDSGEDQVLAFPDGTTALFGPAAQVRAMLDVGFGFAPPASEEGELAQALKQLTTADTVWAVGRGAGNLPSRVGLADSGLSNVPALVSFSLSARVSSRVRVHASAETRNPEAAGSLADLVRGLAAMGALQGQSDEVLRALSDSLEVETIDDQVDISFEVDADAVREYLRPRVGRDRKHQARGQNR